MFAFAAHLKPPIQFNLILGTTQPKAHLSVRSIKRRGVDDAMRHCASTVTKPVVVEASEVMRFKRMSKSLEDVDWAASYCKYQSAEQTARSDKFRKI